ncbi:MAG: hypothetical protein ACE5JX_22965 [Acidobacteriota bacterium]
MPAGQLGFRLQNGAYHGEILFMGQVFNDQGEPVSKKLPITRGFNLNLTPEQFSSLAGQPLLLGNEIKLKGGRYRLVLIVEDRLSGTLGATERTFEMP